MTQSTESNRPVWILACLSGCAFSLLYKWSIAEYGWNLHIGFELLSAVMFGTILQYLPLSLRYKHSDSILFLGMIQKVELRLQRGLDSFSTIQHILVKTNETLP